MNVLRPFRRAAVLAIVALAAIATLLSACSSSSDDAAATSSAATDNPLTTAQAQDIIRTAVNGDTSLEDLEKVLDTSTPGVAQALNGFAKGASKAGYTPDVYTVKSIKDESEDKAVAVTAIKSPHAPEPIDLDLAFVKKDGDWKLAAGAVDVLVSMGR